MPATTKPKYALLFILFVGVIGSSFYFLARLYVDNRTLQEKINDTDREVKQQRRDIRDLRAHLEALQNDPKAVERIARKHLRMSRENETVYTFSDPNPAPRTTDAKQARGPASRAGNTP
ncbi:MAG: septum formation initiator family protein [Victivallales bacterium]|nr:septum formation initiator family protein [Victivallales bacterium]